MRVGDVCTRSVVHRSRNASALEAAKLMRETARGINRTGQSVSRIALSNERLGQDDPSSAGCAMMIKSETRPFAAIRSASGPGSAGKRADRPLLCGTIDVTLSSRSENKARAVRYSSGPSKRATSSNGLLSTVSTVTEGVLDGAA